MGPNLLRNDIHRRLNILTGEWVIVSPQRTKRPWNGQVEGLVETRPQYDKDCYLCPGNTRAGGVINPYYSSTFVFDNDFSALQPESPNFSFNQDDLLVAKSEQGICRVICFSPRHDLTLPEMDTDAIEAVVELWRQQYLELGSRKEINYVQIFENKGQAMGCSNPHPHGQIWASQSIPDEPLKEQWRMFKYYDANKKSLLSSYLTIELDKNERIVFQNDDFVALVPFWAIWPFETMIISRRHIQNLTQMSKQEFTSLAEILKRLTTAYDNLFEVSFPYCAGIHQSPTDGLEHLEWHLHMHFYPPLLRSATVKKFMVGYEMLANSQRDITPEYAANTLRSLPQLHYGSKR